MDEDRPILYLLIGRVADADPDGPCVQIKLGLYEEPSRESLIEQREALESCYEEAFGAKPARVDVVVLPWVSEHDETEE